MKGYEYDFMGKAHWMTEEEAISIEASGKSSWEAYRFEEVGEDPPPFHSEKILALHARPGKTRISDLRVSMRWTPAYYNSRMRWDPKEDDALNSLREEGHSWYDIAVILGRSISAVSERYDVIRPTSNSKRANVFRRLYRQGVFAP